ncbi:MAG: hypothetical protein IJ870_03610 [Alphaproteobacteria bacterium]|nr:hypothetical protein [Alphaproteobacteria bacterium]
MIGSVVGLVAGLIAYVVACMCNMSEKNAHALSIIFGISFALFGSYLRDDCQTKRKASWENGVTIEALVKRAELQKGTILSQPRIFILTEDERLLTTGDANYALVAQGDTIVYRLSTRGDTKILSVKSQ